MKRQRLLIILILCLLAYAAIFGIRTTRVETIQNLVSQGLKMGATSEQVLSFLDIQHLQHTRLFKPDFMQFGNHNYGNQVVIVATKPNTWIGLIQRESIRIVFVFNANNQLVRFDVFPIYTGL